MSIRTLERIAAALLAVPVSAAVYLIGASLAYLAGAPTDCRLYADVTVTGDPVTVKTCATWGATVVAPTIVARHEGETE